MHRHAPRRFAAPARNVRKTSWTSLEWLESRRLLSTAGGGPTITPLVAQTITADRWHHGGGGTGGGFGGTGTTTTSAPLVGSMTPAQLSAAYGFAQSPDTGAGQTIAIVDAYNDPNIQADLAAFSKQFNLPQANLTVLNQNGQTVNLPQSDASWSLEIALDVEWVHALAPAAKIVLVEANSANVGDLMKAVQTAANNANVVSMSWGGSEFQGEQQYDSSAYFGKPGVTFVAASGDTGGASGAQWPASSPNVVSVGGTSLALSAAGGYGSETAWDGNFSWFSGASGSGGGVSTIEAMPSYQASALGTAYASGRVTPDVASDADPGTGLAVYDSYGATGWTIVGGTSAGAPVWSAIVANADQARTANHLGSLSSSQTLAFLYGLSGSSTSYAANFHDITTGANFVAFAAPGYDAVTGLGTPIANNLIASAASFGAAPAAGPHATSTLTPVTTKQPPAAPSPSKHKEPFFVISVTITPALLNPTPQSSNSLGSLATAATTTAAPATTFGQSLVDSTSFSRPVARLAFRPNQPYVSPITIEPFNEPVPTESPVAPQNPDLYDDPIIQPDLKFEAPLFATPTVPQAPLWDTALGTIGDEPAIRWDDLSIPTPPAIDTETTAPAVGSAVVAGVAIALWRTWQRRPSATGTERRRWNIPLEELHAL